MPEQMSPAWIGARMRPGTTRATPTPMWVTAGTSMRSWTRCAFAMRRAQDGRSRVLGVDPTVSTLMDTLPSLRFAEALRSRWARRSRR